jgi:hypothetical protein
MPASIRPRPPVSSGDKPGSMIRKIITSRISRRGRKLDRLPRYLTVRGNRDPMRWSQAKRTTVLCREQHGRPPQCRNGRPALSRKRRHRLCRPHHRRPPGNLAASQQALSGLVAPAILRAGLGRTEPRRVHLNVLEAQAQFDGPQRNVSVRLAEQDGRIYLDLADEFWRSIEIGPNGWRIAEDPPVGRS